MNKKWFAPEVLPEARGKFIDEIVIEYENDIGTFHAIGLFYSDDGKPVFIEVMTGTKIDWNRTVKRWRYWNEY